MSSDERWASMRGSNNPMCRPEVAAKQGAKLRGDNNPMRRPEVAAKQSASLRETWRNPAMRAEMTKHTRRWTPEQRAAQSARLKAYHEKVGPTARASKKNAWTPEKRAAASAKARARWEKIKAALAMVHNAQHDDIDASE